MNPVFRLGLTIFSSCEAGSFGVLIFLLSDALNMPNLDFDLQYFYYLSTSQ